MANFTLFWKRLIKRWASQIIVLAFFLIALLPRLAAIDRYITPDELIWVFRSVQFREAILHGNWVDTVTTGHPGVLTTWLGAGAISLQLMVRSTSQVAYDWILKLAWFAPENSAAFDQLAVFLTAGRLAVVLVNSLGIVFIYLLTERLFSRPVAVIGTLFLAIDPFVSGLSGLLHVDSLMTTFATLSLLVLSLSWHSGLGRLRPFTATAVSAFFAALAILSKTPAVLLIPLSLFFLFLANMERTSSKWGVHLRPFLKQSVSWIVAHILTLFAFLPALWVSPVRVIQLLGGEANKHLENALRPTFFMGDVAYEHGFLFYPVSLLFRLSPFVLIGIVLSILLFVRRQHHHHQEKSRLLTCALLLFWILLFLVGISFAEKKFDRYAVAVIPALILIAAWFWGNIAIKWQRIVWPMLVLGQVIYLFMYMPYPLAAYNPLMGGPAAARRMLPMGWGEAVSASGQWLANLPDVETKTAVSPISPSLAPFFPGKTLLFDEQTVWQADYLILTANTLQTESAAQIDAWTTDTVLRQTIHFGGIDQAWIYERPSPVIEQLDLDELQEVLTFGNGVQLLAAGINVSSTQLDLVANWSLLPGGENGRYLVNISLEDDSGNEWLTSVTPLLNETYFYPVHWMPGEEPQIHYSWSLPPGIPPADYLVSLSLLEEDTGGQLPILAENGRFMGTTTAVAQVTIPQSRESVNLSSVPIAIPHNLTFLDNRLLFLGQEPLLETAVTGSPLPIDLVWFANAPLRTDIEIQFILGEYTWQTPLSRYPSKNWRTGELVYEKYRLPIPPSLMAGEYELTFQLVTDSELMTAPNGAVSLGIVHIDTFDRQFELPENIENPMFYEFNNEIQLRGFDGGTELKPGETLHMTLFWQVLEKPAQLYSVFFHVIDEAGNTIALADQWPGGLPTELWVPGQVIVDAYTVELPMNAPESAYTVSIGIYRPEDGLRLPITDAAGNLLDEDRILLPVK